MADFTELSIINSLLMAANILKLGQNEETLAGTKTLVTTDKVMQKLNPGGASRDVILSAITNDLMFIVHNSGTVATFNLVVKNPAAATLATLGPGMMGVFHCGTAWKWLDDSGIYYDAVSGNRGVGTTSPLLKYDINNGSTNYTIGLSARTVSTLTGTGNIPIALFSNNTNTLNSGVGIRFGAKNGNGSINTTLAQIHAVIEQVSTGVPNYGGLQLSVINGITFVAALRIINTGKIGVMNTTPTYELDVTGDIRATKGIYQTSYNKIEDFDEEAAGVQLEAGLRADEWTGGGTNYASANVTYTGAVHGEVSIATATADDDSAFILGLPQHSIDNDPIFEVRFKMTDITNGFCGLGLVEGSFVNKTTYDDDICLVGIDSDNAHGFGAARLVLITNDNNAGAIIDDLGVNLVAGTYVKIKVDLTDTEQPRVWVNDTEVAAGNITGTVQAGITMANYAMAQALSAAADTLVVDYIKNWSTR